MPAPEKKGSIEEKLTAMHVSTNKEENDNDMDDDFVPVGFDYDQFNTMAEGILHLEKPKTDAEENRDLFSYESLLSRIEKYLKPSERDAETKVKIPISIKKEGLSKTSLNIVEICNVIKREVSHLRQYIEVELSVNCSIDKEGHLILKGLFTETQVQKIVSSYIKQYVTCGVCSSLNTILEKEDKLLFKKCLSCNATQSVNTIQQGYKALTTKRSVLRRKTGE